MWRLRSLTKLAREFVLLLENRQEVRAPRNDANSFQSLADTYSIHDEDPTLLEKILHDFHDGTELMPSQLERAAGR